MKVHLFVISLQIVSLLSSGTYLCMLILNGVAAIFTAWLFRRLMTDGCKFFRYLSDFVTNRWYPNRYMVNSGAFGDRDVRHSLLAGTSVYKSTHDRRYLFTSHTTFKHCRTLVWLNVNRSAETGTKRGFTIFNIGGNWTRCCRNALKSSLTEFVFCSNYTRQWFIRTVAVCLNVWQVCGRCSSRVRLRGYSQGFLTALFMEETARVALWVLNVIIWPFAPEFGICLWMSRP